MILSFYSYKGGVGRTSLAVETAARLATGGFVESAAEPARPHRVLLWDLDLEAPGIAHFPVLRDLAGRAGAGTADLLRLLWQPPGAPRDDISAPEPVEIRQVLEQAIVPETAVTGGALGVLFPAASGVHPGEALAELELSTLFGPEGTAPPLLALVAQLAEEELGYEFVVVDARTGINDLAASATAALADAAVLVLRLDSQDIDNVARVADSIDRAWQRPGAMTEHRLLRVATMVPSDGGETRAAVEERRCQLDELKLAPHVELPLRPLALVREAVPTLENLRFDTRTTEAFEEVAAWARETWVDLHSSAARVSGGTRSATDRRRRGAAAAAAGRRFEEEVADLLHLGGWRTTVDVAMTGGQIDIVAEKQGEFGQRQVMLVECKSGVSGGTLNDVEKLDCRADDAGREHGVVYTKMLVARRFAGNAHRVAQLRGVLLATPADLLNAQAPAEPVRRRALRAWEGTAVERQYVEPHAVMLDDDGARRGSRRSLEGLAADWLGGVEQGLLAVLGDAGAGKSTFCRRLAYTMAKGDDRDTGSRERPLPLVVDLKSAGTVALTIDGMLTHALRSDADVDAVRLAPWRQRLREGSLVLLVDGFDEVLGYSDPAQMERLLGELREAATAGRVILTSRTSYFRSHHDATTAITGRPRLVSSEQATSYWRAIGDVADVRAVEIMPFDDRQIEQFLTRRLQPGSDVGAVLRRLRGLHPVDDLLRQPYLLVLVSDSVEGWERTKWPAVLTLAALYEAYAEHWLQRDSVRHAMLRTADAADLASGLIEHLARTMWSRPSAQMTTRELRATATAWVGEHVGRAVSPDEEDRLEAEVRTALFLVRDEAGAYRFAHRSFMEFFIAKGLARVLATSSDELGSTTEEVAAAFDLVNLSPEILRFLQGWPQSWDAAPAAARSILTSPYRARTSENALLLGYWHGRFSHAQGPVDLLPGGVAQLAGAALAGIDLAGAVLRGADLTGADLTRVLLDTAVLAGATMRNASCDNAQFARADLLGADLRQASFVGAQLTGADLGRVKARGASFNRAALRGANIADVEFDEVNLADADLRHADLRRTSLKGADLVVADLRCARVTDADLSGATATGANFDNVDLRQTRLEGAGLRFARLRGTHAAFRGADTFGSRLDVHPAELSNARASIATGHTGPITAACAVPVGDTTLLATAGHDGTARLWDPTTGACLHTLTGHTDWITAACAVPVGDTTLLATAGHDGTARLWDPTTGACLHTLTGHTDRITAACAVPVGDTTLLATAGHDGTARLWDPTTGACRHTLTGHTDWITAACAVPVGDTTLLATAGHDGTARLWDPTTGACRHTLTGHTDRITATCAVPVGDTTLLATAGRDRTARLWDPTTGACRHTLTGHTDRITATCAVPVGDTTLLATAGRDRTARLWDPTTGACRHTLTGHTDWITATCAVPVGDTTLLATAGRDRTARLWDPTTGACRHTLTGHTDWIRTTCAVPVGDTTLLATAGRDRTARLWDPTTGACLHTLTGHTDWITAACAVPVGDTTLLATAGHDGTARLWDPTTGACRHTLTGHTDWITATCAVPVGDTTLLATAGDDGTARLWDPTTGACLHTLTGHTDRIRTACAVPVGDTTLLATAGDDGTARLWDPTTGACRHTLTGHTDRITATCAVPVGDATLLATAGDDGTARLWDPTTGACRHTLTGHTDRITATCAVPVGDATLLATAGDDRTARLWDPTTGACLHTLTGHTGPITAACAVPVGDATLLATAGDDGTARLWDPTTGACRHTLTGHTDWIRTTCAVPVGDTTTLLATAGHDGTARLWDPTTGACRHTLTGHTGPITAACAVPVGDTTLLATAGHDGTARLWDPTTGGCPFVTAGADDEWLTVDPDASIGRDSLVAYGTRGGIDTLLIAGRWDGVDVRIAWPSAVRIVDEDDPG